MSTFLPNVLCSIDPVHMTALTNTYVATETGLRCDLQGGELRHVAEGERGKKTDAVITEVSAEETHTNTQQIQLHVYNMPSQSQANLITVTLILDR